MDFFFENIQQINKISDYLLLDLKIDVVSKTLRNYPDVLQQVLATLNNNSTQAKHACTYNGYKKVKVFNKFVNNGLDEEIRITINNDYVENIFLLNKSRKIISSLQLLKGPRNHTTLNHLIDDTKITMLYYDKNKHKLNTFNIKLHYCQNCDVYFDFKNSFEGQLSKVEIKPHNVLASFYNEQNSKIKFQHFELKDYSILSLFGYHVGKNGLPKYKREEILNYVLQNKYMSNSQIKNFLEYLIKFHSTKSNYQSSIKDWKSDIQYLNDLIK